MSHSINVRSFAFWKKMTCLCLTVALIGCDGLVFNFIPISPDDVRLEVLPHGQGSVSIVPVGTPEGAGVLFPEGTTVTLAAEADPGWDFVGFYTEAGALLSDQFELDLVLNADYQIVAQFAEIVVPPPPAYIGDVVIGADEQFLGLISDDPFDPESLSNPFGLYGDEFSDLSIWNSFGTYGDEFGDFSAYDPVAGNPPGVYLNGSFVGYLTKNPDFSPVIDPDDLAEAIGRYDVIRN